MNNTIIKNENDFLAISFEKCVICDKETNVPEKLDVNLRSSYVEGVGQLCQKCFDTKALVIE